MTGTELRAGIVEAIRRLNATDHSVRAFHEAFRYRQVEASTFEAEPGRLGLGAALQRAFVVYDPGEGAAAVERHEREPTDGFLSEIVAAAQSIADAVYERFAGRLRRLGQVPRGEDQMRQLVSDALFAYARRRKEHLSPGP